MARAKKNNVNNTINIKSLPVQCHVGASKFVNDDWGTIAFSIPRNQIQNKFADVELRYNFIYFLFGYEGSKEAVYVGQAKKRNDGESVLKRLREHDKSTTERYRDQWAWIVAVTNKDDAWGLDDLNALEHAFYNEIPSEQNLNGNNPNSGGANYEAYTDKINQIKSLITAVGFNIFCTEETAEKIQVTSEVNEYTIVEDLQNGMARIPEIVTPQKVVKSMVDMLPLEVWNSRTTFLDPACKGGECLREIYDRLMETETLQAEFPNAIERSNHILKNQIYGIALSQVSLERTTKKLLGEDRNIRVIPNYIDKLKGKGMGTKPDGSQNNIRDILNKEFGKDMKFDVVIGNPPYQETVGGSRGNLGRDIFDQFVINGIGITSKYVSMIVPTKWYNKDSLSGMRELLIKDNHLGKLVEYNHSNEIFNGADIGGGVCYFLFRKDKHFENTEITNCLNGTKNVALRKLHINNNVIIDNKAFGIIEKTLSGSRFTPETGDNPFHIKSTEIGDVIPVKGDDIRLIKGQEEYFFRKENIEYSDLIYRHKCSIGKMNPDRGGVNNSSSWNVINTPKILGIRDVIAQNFMILFSDENVENVYRFVKYAKSKFLRFLVLQGMSGTSLASKSNWIYVPLQDFTLDSDIDWSKSIAEIDQQLYKKYGLSQEEIDYIEKTIKPME